VVAAFFFDFFFGITVAFASTLFLADPEPFFFTACFAFWAFAVAFFLAIFLPSTFS